MKLIIDDTFLSVKVKDSGEEVFKGDYTYGHREFNELIAFLLTKSQNNIYIVIDTRRTFNVSEKKLEQAKVKFESLTK